MGGWEAKTCAVISLWLRCVRAPLSSLSTLQIVHNCDKLIGTGSFRVPSDFSICRERATFPTKITAAFRLTKSPSPIPSDEYFYSRYFYGTFGLDCPLFWGFLSAQLLLGPPRPRILRCFQICAQNWQQPSGTEVVAVQSWGPGPIK